MNRKRPSKLSRNFFRFTLVLGFLINVFRHNLPIAWIGLELNLLSFIPLAAYCKHSFTPDEDGLWYLITQALGTAILLVPITCYFLPIPILYFILIISLILKLGATPVRYLLPIIGENGILACLHKITPLHFISTLLNLEPFSPAIILISVASRFLPNLIGRSDTTGVMIPAVMIPALFLDLFLFLF